MGSLCDGWLLDGMCVVECAGGGGFDGGDGAFDGFYHQE